MTKSRTGADEKQPEFTGLLPLLDSGGSWKKSRRAHFPVTQEFYVPVNRTSFPGAGLSGEEDLAPVIMLERTMRIQTFTGAARSSKY
ncbi:MAG: hypothetical protein IBX61_08100 [Thermoleophilia bacterium]|nr:hypothetical protein [Thermoleophilia bacterium]